jgi:hypothetical protein
MANERIVDADCHILEPPDIWENWLAKKYADKAPRLVKDPAGGDAWLTAVGGDPDPIGLVSTPGMPYDKFRWFGVTYEEARTGCYNGVERLADMDIDGIHAEILFPPQRTMSHFLGDDDPDFVLAGVDAYNNFLFDEFCAPDPTRLIGIAQIPSIGIDAAIEGLRKAKARGAHGVLISNWPAGGESLSPDDDPFWAAAVDEGMPVSIHINIISRNARMSARKAAVAQGNQLYNMASEATRAKAIGGMSHVFAMANCRSAGSKPASVGSRTSSNASTTAGGATVRGVACRSSSRRRSTGIATTRRASSLIAAVSSCATAPASTTSCGRATIRTTATTGRTRARSSTR